MLDDGFSEDYQAGDFDNPPEYDEENRQTMGIGTFQKITAQTGKPRRLIIEAWGKQKRGKTRFALTAPQPIYFFDFDRGVEDLLPQFSGLEIYHVTCRSKLVGIDSLAQQEKLYDTFLSNVEAVKNEVTSGTVVIDTISDLWTLIQAIQLEEVRQEKREQGKKDKQQRFDYNRCNIHYQEVIKSLIDNPYLNICLLGRATEVYSANGEATGTFKAQHQKDTPYLSQIVIQLDKEGDGAARQYKGLIEDWRSHPELEGIVVPNPTWNTFVELAGE